MPKFDPIHPFTSRIPSVGAKRRLASIGRATTGFPPKIDWAMYEQALAGSKPQASGATLSRSDGVVDLDTFVPPYLRSSLAEHLPYWYPGRNLVRSALNASVLPMVASNSTHVDMIREELTASIRLAASRYGWKFRRTGGSPILDNWKSLSLDVHPSDYSLATAESMYGMVVRLVHLA